MSKRPKYLLFTLAVLAVAAPAVAALVVNYTLQPVTAADCLSVMVTRQSNGQGGTVLVTTFTFEVKAAGGVVRETGATSLQLSPAQASALSSFVTSNGVPAFNTQRGL